MDDMGVQLSRDVVLSKLQVRNASSILPPALRALRCSENARDYRLVGRICIQALECLFSFF